MPATRLTLSAAKPPPSSRLRQSVRAFAGRRVVVWGDFLLDEYWQCRSTRVSREAPVLVLDYRSRSAEGGGAANAALNLAALGAEVAVVGWVGPDGPGREIRARLVAACCDVRGLLVHPKAPTVVKTRKAQSASPHRFAARLLAS